MPPILPFLPLILGAGELGLGIAGDLKKPATATPAPVTTIPGSPTSIIDTGGTPTGKTGVPSSVASQIMGGGAGGTSTGSAGAGKSTSVPASIFSGTGGGGSDFNALLPWFNNQTGGTGASPGTPAAGV